MSRWSSCFECGKAAHDRYKCAKCGAVICPRHTYYYADESNAAITKSARPKCWVHFEWRASERGVLDRDNLLLSGDFADRDFSRSLFEIVLTPHGSRVISSPSTSRTAGETMFESAEIRGRIGVAEVKARNAQTSEPSATPLPIRAFGAAPMSVPETPPVETVSGGN